MSISWRCFYAKSSSVQPGDLASVHIVNAALDGGAGDHPAVHSSPTEQGVVTSCCSRAALQLRSQLTQLSRKPEHPPTAAACSVCLGSTRGDAAPPAPYCPAHVPGPSTHAYGVFFLSSFAHPGLHSLVRLAQQLDVIAHRLLQIRELVVVGVVLGACLEGGVETSSSGPTLHSFTGE